MCIRISGKPLPVLMSGIGIAILSVGSALAAAPASSAIPSATTLVIRGANETTVPSSGEDDSPVVLRGSPVSPALPFAPAYPCAAGYLYEPGYGCAAPSYAYEPYDYGYDYGFWPYWGFDGFYSGSRRRSFPHGFVHRAGRRPAVRFAFGHGFAHSGGFGHFGGSSHR
jgi:hypothetical protein